MEVFGILVFRTGRPGDPDGARRVFVFRLSDLDEFIEADAPALDLNVPTWQPKSREDMKENALECSKACSLFCLSRKESSSCLRMAMAVGSKKVLVLKWRHPEVRPISFS